MRRLAALTVIALLALLVPTVTAIGVTATYADDFSEGGYAGNDGTLEFWGPWEEFGDAGGHTSGNVHVGPEYCSDNSCLHIEGPGLLVNSFGIDRSADTSVFNSAQLKYDIFIDGQAGDLAQLLVEVWNGSAWVVVHTYDLSVSVSKTKNVPINPYLCDEFAVRFKIPGLFEGGPAVFTGAVTIDKVEISGSLMSTTTTTSSTTTTTEPTTTTSEPTTTTTSEPTTTTSEPTTTTSEPTTTTSSEEDAGTGGPLTTTTAPTTTTTASFSTSTSVAGAAPPPDDEPPQVFEPGIRDAGTGLIVDYQGGMNGDMVALDGVEVLSAEVTTEFSLAVEAFKTAKVWLAALSLMIAAALVSGMDHRRKTKGDLALFSAGEPLVEG